MSTNPEAWHAPLEVALQADLGEVEALRTKWYPMPPSEDWMVIVDDATGRRRGILITQLFTPITEMLFMILEDEIIEGTTTWIAVPSTVQITESRLAFLQGLDVRLIPCQAPDWAPSLPVSPRDWTAEG
jgi:hypothetical protein